MNLYRLALRRQYPDGTYQELGPTLVIRAGSAKEARRLAASVFDPYTQSKESPWGSPKGCSCKVLKPAGPTAVIFANISRPEGPPKERP